MLRSLVIALTALLVVTSAAAADSASVDGGVLKFSGTPGRDNVQLIVLDGGTVAMSSETTAGTGCAAQKKTNDVQCTGVQRIEVDLGDENDDFHVIGKPVPSRPGPTPNPTMPVTVRGGAGNDSLAGGDGNDTLDGGPGEDLINAYGGDDTLYSADGMNDSTADCGDGRDQAIMDERAGYRIQEEPRECERVERHVNLAAGATPTAPGRVYLYLEDRAGVANDISVTETRGTFTLRDGAGLGAYPGCGTLDAQTVRCGPVFRFDFDLGAGDDRMGWRGGVSTITQGFAGDGNDTLILGPGKDFVYGGDGNDTLNGGPGFDTLKDDEGADTIVGGGGFDILEGGAGPDRFDLRDGGAMALRKGAKAETWEASFDEPTDCDAGDKLLVDPLDPLTRCEQAISVADTDAKLPASAMPKITRIAAPDLVVENARVALACPRAACRGGVASFAGKRRVAFKSFALRAGAKTVVSIPADGAKRIVVQASDGSGRTRSVSRRLPKPRY
jgi:Ca2+-binding RTX toxin-like protein